MKKNGIVVLLLVILPLIVEMSCSKDITGPPKETSASMVEILVSVSGFHPPMFEVKSGSKVTLIISSGDNRYVVTFDDSTLSNVMVGVNSKDTRSITFTAPVAGEYPFRSVEAGLIGKMVVF